MHYIIFFSGGAGSYCAARRIAFMPSSEVASYRLLFTDTRTEDADLYRFIDDAPKMLGSPSMIRLQEGRNIWQVFRDEKYLGNSRVDICSRILKRDMARKWVHANCLPAETTLVFGFDWNEEHRLKKTAAKWAPYKCIAPLLDPPYLEKNDMLEEIKKDGIEIPSLYKSGAPHNNCGGFCVRAGMAHFAWLLKTYPDRYAYHEEQERLWQEATGLDNTIIRSREGGVVTPVSLKDFRQRVADGHYDHFEWGGCGCFSED